jgi:hypothetical protein
MKIAKMRNPNYEAIVISPVTKELITGVDGT